MNEQLLLTQYVNFGWLMIASSFTEKQDRVSSLIFCIRFKNWSHIHLITEK